MSHEQIIGWLRNRQQERGEVDKQFAAHLGMSRAQWQMLRAGTTRIGRRSGRAIVAAYPVLMPWIAALFLQPEASILAEQAR